MEALLLWFTAFLRSEAFPVQGATIWFQHTGVYSGGTVPPRTDWQE